MHEGTESAAAVVVFVVVDVVSTAVFCKLCRDILVVTVVNVYVIATVTNSAVVVVDVVVFVVVDVVVFVAVFSTAVVVKVGAIVFMAL